jgi:hypothetical protein
MGDPSQSLFCDINNNEFCIDATDNSGNLRHYCGNIKCKFNKLNYNPSLDDISQPAFKTGDNKIYISNPYGIQGLRRDVTSSMQDGAIGCTVQDCIGRLQENGIESETVNLTNGECKGSFDPSIINPTPKNPTTCPFSDTSRCCSDANGLTGQVCKEGQTCYGNVCTSCVDANCNGYGKCSRTVADTCVCDHGHDPQSQCQNCLPGLTVKTINGYNYCVTGDVQSFNYWNLDQGSSGSDWAVLSTDDNKYINGGHDGRNVVFSFNANLISDGIKKIIFEPTGDINVLTQYQLRQFPGDILVSVFGNSNTISTIDVTNDLIYSGFNYYLKVYVSDAGKVKFNVYFSK